MINQQKNVNGEFVILFINQQTCKGHLTIVLINQQKVNVQHEVDFFVDLSPNK